MDLQTGVLKNAWGRNCRQADHPGENSTQQISILVNISQRENVQWFFLDKDLDEPEMTVEDLPAHSFKMASDLTGNLSLSLRPRVWSPSGASCYKDSGQNRFLWIFGEWYRLRSFSSDSRWIQWKTSQCRGQVISWGQVRSHLRQLYSDAILRYYPQYWELFQHLMDVLPSCSRTVSIRF